MGINQIILSCNEDPTYMEFWKPVSQAYKKMFPDVIVHLAFLTHRDETDPLVEHFREFGKVTLFKPVSGVAEFGQAKMIRFLLASQQEDDICYIDDIDLYPLRREFIQDKTNKRPKDTLLCVGGEVYDKNGCYPISQMTAEGYIWKKFINPQDQNYPELLKHWSRPFKEDFREDITVKLDFSQDSYFSDERLLRRLTSENPVQKFEIKRGYDNFLQSTIDRHTFNGKKDLWEYDRDKLNNHVYVNAHGIRPFNKFTEHYKPLIQYIEDNYGTK